MRTVLRQSNYDLLREVTQLQEVLRSTSGTLPSELEPYYDWAAATCGEFHRHVTRNLRDLGLGQDSILPELMSVTQKVTQRFSQFNRHFVSPLIRVRSADRLCLRLLHRLHTAHPQTQQIPVGLSDGDFASWPVPPSPIIYMMPPSAQQGLLYLPLFFHEFGHLLYACHRPEMDTLVRELQETLAELLEPDVQRDDRYAQTDIERRRQIVEVWYEWAQELFCDAVGVRIGGPAFASAFSMYLRMRGRGEYHLSPEDLARRVHPVTWLRIQLLADRERRMDQDKEADELETTWTTIAKELGIVEDYYGFYDPQFLPAIRQTIDDMVTEAAPLNFAERARSPSQAVSSDPPVELLNQAWQRFRADPEGYRVWEKKAIAAFLAT